MLDIYNEEGQRAQAAAEWADLIEVLAGIRDGATARAFETTINKTALVRMFESFDTVEARRDFACAHGFLLTGLTREQAAHRIAGRCLPDIFSDLTRELRQFARIEVH